MTSKSREAYYSNYKSQQRWKQNRERKLKKLLKADPDNKQLQDALANIKYRRKKPTTRQWSKSNRRIAQLLKEVSGSCPHNVFSSNPKVSAEALASLWRTHQPGSVPEGKVDFSLAARSYSWKPA